MCYCTFIFYPKWKNTGGESALGWDVAGYYWYLPSTFIYKDLKQQKFGDSIMAKYQFTPTFWQSTPHPKTGNRVMGYSSGTAFMYLPFFAVAHLLAEPLGYEADGFSLPYQTAIQIGALLFAIMSLWYFRKLFLLFYSDGVVAALMILLVFGTNYLNYTAIDGALTHNWLFGLYVFLLLNTYYFYRKPSYKYAARIGALCGLITLIRPSEMIAVLIPLLWGIESISWKAITGRLQFIKEHIGMIGICALCGVAVAGIQILYWLYTAHEPFVYSYGNQGFYWSKPFVMEYMFSYRSGWITYTPLMILSFIGILPFLRFGKNKLAVLSVFFLSLYITCAWEIWWYGGTGGRAMIQSYPIILFPFATLLQYIFSKRWLTLAAAPVILLFTAFNLWFTYAAHAGENLYDPNGMTKGYYWRILFRTKVPLEYSKLKDTDEMFEGTPKAMKLLYTNDFEADTNAKTGLYPGAENNHALYIAPRNSTPEYNIAYKHTGANWLRAQAMFKIHSKEWESWRMTQFVVRFKKEGQVVKERQLRLFRLMDMEDRKTIFIDVKIPEEEFDTVSVLLWGGESDHPIIMDNLAVYEFKE
jgi:hypothetical protein